jgi:hypothetical protein
MGAGVRAGWSSLIGAFERAVCCCSLFGHAGCSCVLGERCCAAQRGMAWRACYMAYSLEFDLGDLGGLEWPVLHRGVVFRGIWKDLELLIRRDSIVAEMANWI